MFTNRLQTTLLLSTIFLFSGCVYPVYKTISPTSTIYVVDEQAKPIKEVKVYLFSDMMHGRDESNLTQQTDAKGFAHFDRVSQWKLESLMIHGRSTYYWNWCVEKEGFETKFTYGYTGFEEEKKFMLREGTHTPCSFIPKNYFYPDVVKHYDFATRYKNGEMYQTVRGLIAKVLNPQTTKEAYAQLQKLPAEYVPYIIMNMNDRRAIPVQLLSFTKDTEHTFESVPHYDVRRVIEVLDLVSKYILKRNMPRPEYTHYHNRMYNSLLKRWRLWLYLH